MGCWSIGDEELRFRCGPAFPLLTTYRLYRVLQMPVHRVRHGTYSQGRPYQCQLGRHPWQIRCGIKHRQPKRRIIVCPSSARNTKIVHRYRCLSREQQFNVHIAPRRGRSLYSFFRWIDSQQVLLHINSCHKIILIASTYSENVVFRPHRHLE